MAASEGRKPLSIRETVDIQRLSYSMDELRHAQLSASGRPYDKVVVGAAILQSPSSPTSAGTPRILLLKRASHELYFPNVFEVPGGNVDQGDPSLNYALAREVKEETGLDASAVLAELSPMTYKTEKTITNDSGEEIYVVKSAIQLNYVLSVSDGAVRLNANEHSESRWVTEEESVGLDITDEMRAAIREAFAWAANR